MCLYTFIQHSHTYVWACTKSHTHSQAETHRHKHRKSRHAASPPAFLSYAQSRKSLFSPSDTISLHLLSPLASLPVLSGKLFLLSIRYAPLLDILHFYPLTEEKKNVIPKKGFVIPLSHAWNNQYFHRQPGRQGT